MIKLSNPRREARIEDWPSGRNRVTAVFAVEANNRGERVTRTTTGKPKATIYYRKVCIVDGDDDRTYVLGKTEFDQIVLIPGTLKTVEYFREDDPEYAPYESLLDSV